MPPRRRRQQEAAQAAPETSLAGLPADLLQVGGHVATAASALVCRRLLPWHSCPMPELCNRALLLLLQMVFSRLVDQDKLGSPETAAQDIASLAMTSR